MNEKVLDKSAERARAQKWVNDYFNKLGRPNVTANVFTYEQMTKLMADYAALTVEREREACAKIADAQTVDWSPTRDGYFETSHHGKLIAKTIRARDAEKVEKV